MVVAPSSYWTDQFNLPGEFASTIEPGILDAERQTRELDQAVLGSVGERINLLSRATANHDSQILDCIKRGIARQKAMASRHDNALMRPLVDRIDRILEKDAALPPEEIYAEQTGTVPAEQLSPQPTGDLLEQGQVATAVGGISIVPGGFEAPIPPGGNGAIIPPLPGPPVRQIPPGGVVLNGPGGGGGIVQPPIGRGAMHWLV